MVLSQRCKPDFTEEILERAVRAFHAKEGTTPGVLSGDASAYFGWAEIWKNVDQCLYKGGRGLAHLKGSSLAKYAESLGLKNSKPDFTEEILERAVRAFHAQHGKAPGVLSGDASVYFGWDETWTSVLQCIRKGSRGLAHLKGSSLSKYAESLGLKTSKPDFTEEVLERAVRAFHAQHGKIPNANSGDASAYFGWDEFWRNVDACIRTGIRGLAHMKGLSLTLYAANLGLKTSKPDFTEEILERAVRAFHAQHGKTPGVLSGDAFAYFGWPETWISVNHCFRLGLRGLTHLKGSSLAKYCKTLNLKDPHPTPAPAV